METLYKFFDLIAPTLAYRLLMFLLLGTHRVSKSVGIDVGTATAGIGTATNFDFEFVPEQISFITTAAPDIQFQVNEDGVLYNVAAAGVAEMGVIRQLGRFANAYRITLANGKILNKTCRLTITNQTAAAFTVYENSSRFGNMYYVTETLQALASRPTLFKEFSFISFPAAGATDLFTVKWGNGMAQNMRREEFRFRLQSYQNVINTAGYDLDNLNALLNDQSFNDRLSEIQILPVAQQSVFRQKFQQVGPIVTGLQ